MFVIIKPQRIARSSCRLRRLGFTRVLYFTVAVMALCTSQHVVAQQLTAGAAKIDISNYEAGPVSGPMHARALVIRSGDTTAVIVSVDAVAIGEIGPIKNDYLGNVRARIQKELGIDPANLIVNASHCHGLVRSDSDDLTFQAIKQATESMTPVTIGVGHGHEDRVQENRRLKLKSGREADVRHAYSLPADEEVAEVGPIDPEIGILRLDRMNGETLAVVYNFACHPIQGVPNKANTADMTGFSSQVIEDNLSDGTVALFVQGCGGDINPISYKDTHHPRNAESLGNLLGLSTLKAARKIECRADSRLVVKSETLELPRADVAQKIVALEAEQDRLVQSLRGTSLNLKTFLPLVVKYRLAEDFPSYYSHRYLHDEALGRDDYQKLDAENRSNMASYIRNILTMEQLSRNQTNLALLRKHQAQNLAAEKREIDVELVTMRIGDFVMTTFPGELTVRIGLSIKKASAHEHTFVAGYTNGYIYYAPTTEQLQNVGYAQEDSDCILAPGWREIYEAKVVELLEGI